MSIPTSALLDVNLGDQLIAHGEKTARAVVQFGAFILQPALAKGLKQYVDQRGFSQEFEALCLNKKISLSIHQRVSGVKLAVKFFLNGMLLPENPENPHDIIPNPAAIMTAVWSDIIREAAFNPIAGSELYYGVALLLAFTDDDISRPVIDSKYAPGEIRRQVLEIRAKLEASK